VLGGDVAGAVARAVVDDKTSVRTPQTSAGIRSSNVADVLGSL